MPHTSSPAEALGLEGGLEGCPAVFSAGSESWSEGAEMLSIGEVDAADVQVSTEDRKSVV